MIKAIIFDFFGVLCSDEYWQLLGSDPRFNAAFHEYAEEVNTGHIHWNEFVNRIAKSSHTTPDKVTSLYRTEKLNPLMAGELVRLKSHFKLGLISNAHHEYIDSLFARSHLAPLFDVVAVSSRLGVTKPDPRIFEYTLEKLEVQPSESIFIDDIERNVSSAQELGMHTILYQDFIQYRTDLESILSDSQH